MTDQTGTPSSPEPPKLRRRLVTAAPAAAPKVKFVSPAAEGVEVVKPRFLTPELQAKLAQEQEEILNGHIPGEGNDARDARRGVLVLNRLQFVLHDAQHAGFVRQNIQVLSGHFLFR